MDIKVLESQHPEVKAMSAAWSRIRVLVDEDEAGYVSDTFFFDMPNESPSEKAKRKEPFRLGFFNPTQELISTAGDFILRQKIDRQTKSDDLKAFMDKADHSGQSLSDFVKNQAAPNLRAYGTVFGIVDKPRGIAGNKAEERAAGMPYLNILNPCQVKNWAWGKDGRLLWFRYWQASSVEQLDPFSLTPDGEKEYVTWTPDNYFRHNAKGMLVESFAHGFGIVPVAIQAAFLMDSGKTLGKSTFHSSSRHIIMGNNHLNKGNMEILKFGSILIVATNDWDGTRIERKMDPDTNLPQLTDREAKNGEILAVNDMAQRPEFLEKSIEIVDKAISQAWKYFGLAAKAEATGKEAMPLQDAQQGPQSGVSKGYDFQDMDANLFGTAMDLQAFETQVLTIVSSILKVAPEFSVKYPTSFDVRSFKDKIDQFMQLKKAGFQSALALKVAQKRVTGDLTTDPKEQEQINTEIDQAKEPELEPVARPFP